MRSLWREEFPTSTNPFRFFVLVSKPHRAVAFAAMSCVLVADVMSAFFPFTFKYITDAVVALGQGGSPRAILIAGLGYIALSAGREVIWRGSGYMGSFWAVGVRATARDTLARYLTLHSRDYFSNRFAGSLANKVSHAANGVRDFVEMWLWEFMGFFISTIATVSIMFWVHPIFGSLFLVWAAVILPFNIYRARKRIPLSAKTQEVETALTGATVDLLSNVTAMQEYVRRPYEITRLREIVTLRRKTGLANWHYGEETLLINGLIQALFAAGMIYFAVQLAATSAFTAGDFILIITLVYRIEDKFLFLGSHINKLSESWGEVEESLSEIMEPHAIVDAPGARELVVRQGALKFDAVSFAYAGTDTYVLSDLALSVKPGERVGLVGKSGAGKSTLIKLLLRHYEVTRGAIRIDDQSIAETTLDSLRAALSVVPQEPLLFHRSLRENIAYGKPEATDVEIVAAARAACAHEFIEHLPQGYDTLVGERGVKLSGGERQRVAIARAILKNAPILILDEATASLDSESEILIQQALGSLMRGKTVIAIAHRLSTLREMDRIIVLENGRIAEEGTHVSLLEQGGLYATLWTHQAGGFLQDE